MQITKKIMLLLVILNVSSCSKYMVEENINDEKEINEVEETPEETSYILEDVKNPENFVKYYLKSKFSLYNSESLSEIASNNYKLALENPNNIETQEQAFILSLANRDYANALNIINDKTFSQTLTFEDIFRYSHQLAQNDLKNAEKTLDKLLTTQNRLPHLKILKAYFKYQKSKDILALETEINAINSSMALEGFKLYYIARAYEAENNFEKAFQLYSQAFFKNDLRTADVFERIVYTAQQTHKTPEGELFKTSSKYGENIYLVDQSFIDVTKINSRDNSLKGVSSQVFYDLGWSIIQSSANLAGLNFLAVSDYIKPNDKTKFQLAYGLYSNAWVNDAIDILENIPEDSANYMSSQILLKDIYSKHDSKKAIATINKLRQKNIFNEYYLDTILGEIYINDKQFNKAAAYLTKGLNNDQSAKMYFSRGVAYERTGQYQKAIKDLKTALKKNPNNPIILNYLGYLLVDLNIDSKQGLELIKKSIELDPTSAASLDSLGWAYMKLEEYEKALKILEKAYILGSFDGVITGHLGDAYLKNGRKNEAIVYWKKALELEKTDSREIERIKKQLTTYSK